MKRAWLCAFIFATLLLGTARAEGNYKIPAGLGLGYVADAYAVTGALAIRTQLPVKSYLRLGAALVETKNLYPDKPWRRFALICLDNLFYFHDNFYISGGVNFPVKVSDCECGAWGWQALLGGELPYGDGSIFLELGRAQLNREDQEPFEGSCVILGYQIILKDLI